MKVPEYVLRVLARLSAAGHRAYLVGGCVRDMLLGVKPKDYDVVSDATPEQVARIFPEVIDNLGTQFGVSVIPTEGGPVEVAMFRKEEGYSDGRRPDSVKPGTLEEDAMRRDFTINGLYFDPQSGQVIDLVNGTEALNRKLIRAIGNPEARFKEDHLRMLRAVRFAARFGFSIEKRTAEAIKDLAHLIRYVSVERVAQELLKILLSSRSELGIRLMHELNLMKFILPEVEALVGVEQPPEFHPEGDVFEHTCLMLRLLDQEPEAKTESLALAVLLHDIGKPPTRTVKERIRFDGHDQVGAEMAEKICRRLKLSNKLTSRVVSLVRDHMRFRNVKQMRKAKLIRFVTQENFEELLLLHKLDCLASNGKLENYEFCLKTLKEERNRKRPPRLVTGHDLIKLGLKPGPEFKRILEFVEDAALEGQVSSKEEALALVKEKFLD